MLNVDLDKFWEDDELSHQANCFSEKAPQVALGISMSDECVFAELGVEGDPWGTTSREQRIRLNKRYNDKAEKVVGKRLLKEDFPTDDEIFPYVKRIGEVFEGTYTLNNKTGEWLKGKAKTPQDLEGLLDRVDKLNLREFILSSNWEKEKKRILDRYGRKSDLNRWIRGPVTLGMSIYGEDNLMYLYYDEPELYERFSKTIARVIIEMGIIMDVEAGYEEGKAPKGFGFADDNCALLSPEMYEVFGYPVLKQVFDYYSPKEEDNRFQHSDSSMAHLLPILGRLNLTGCNFGPTVLVDEIRKHMPKTRIDGCIAPYTFMNNNIEGLIVEAKRDCEMIKETGTKGLNLSTAGSINNGSSLESMRTIMQVIQTYGRY